jgi:lysozyme family protein
MVAATYDAAMIRVFADEGGYTDDTAKGDRGGPTNFGITIHDARKYWKASATAMDVKAMPKSVAADIYRKHYANPIRYDDLPAGVDYSVLDASINSGQGRALPWMGKASGKTVKTVADLVTVSQQANDKVALIKKYWGTRLSFLQGLSIFRNFGRGWTRRCVNGEAAAVRMWLAVGAGVSASTARKTLDAEAKKASTASKTTGGTAAGATTGGGLTIPQVDTSSMTGKLLLAFGISIAIVLVIWLVRQAIIHNMRSKAYAAA